MSDIQTKDHYFELVMNSYSNGKLNQEVVLVREYADTSGQLALKQMTFTKDAAVTIVQACIDAMENQSLPFQMKGLQEMAESNPELIPIVEEIEKSKGKGNVPPKKK